MRVLIVEDNLKIAKGLEGGFRQQGYAVDRATNGLEGLDLIRQGHYDVAIVDVMLPQLDGVALITTARAEKVKTPVIMLSAKASVDDRIRGLQSGADDYVTKPFSISELVARTQSLLRRTTQEESVTGLHVGDVVMNLLTREVTRGARKLDLAVREFALLEYFLRNPNRVLTKTLILEQLWDFSFDPQTNVVDVLVCRLRSKLDRDFDHKMIHTLRGVGYVFKVD